MTRETLVRVVRLAYGGRGRPVRVRSCGRSVLPAVVPAAAGILPLQACRQSSCPRDGRQSGLFFVVNR
jgi:hypothetical protein